MLWKKPNDLKYVDLCIYIDQNVPRLIEPDCPEEIADTIYNYLWLIVKALAIKKRMFNSFQDYDGYAFYSASRLFFALKKNLENQGKIIKGKEIKPIKSCLNYMKALLYPMKIEFLREEYNLNTIDSAVSKKFDVFTYKQELRNDIWYSQGSKELFKETILDLFKHFNTILSATLNKSPFTANTPDYKKIKISLLLNILNNLKQKKSLTTDPVTILLWKLPKSMSNYIRVFLKEIGLDLKQEIMRSYSDTVIDDRILDYMISNPTGEFISHEE